MLANKNISPVTGSANVSSILNLDIKKTLDLYKSINVKADRFFSNVPSVEILECGDTGYRYYYPFSIFGDGLFYEELQKNDTNYYPREKWEHNTAINYINRNDKVLEVGCADGYFLNRLKNKGAICTGLEFNTVALNQAKQSGLDVYNEMLDVHAEKHPHQYDVVCSFQVLEHIWDIKNYFESVLKCLKPGGKCIVGVPNNNPFIYKNDVYHTLNLPPHHAGLWNSKSLENTGKHFGFKKTTTQLEKLTMIKEWYKSQKNHYTQTKPWLGKLLTIVPWPIAKLFIKLHSPFEEGRNVLALFEL